MSGKLMGTIYELELSQSKQAVLLAMANFAKDDGSGVRPSAAKIAWMIGTISTRQVSRLVNDLVSDGLLILVSKNTGRPCEYRIDLTKGKKKAPMTSRRDTHPGKTLRKNVTVGRQNPVEVAGVGRQNPTEECHGRSANSTGECRGSDDKIAKNEGKMSYPPRQTPVENVEGGRQNPVENVDDPLYTSLYVKAPDRQKKRSGVKPNPDDLEKPIPGKNDPLGSAPTEKEKTVQPHIALIDAYLEALETIQRKPVEVNPYRRRVGIAMAMVKAGIIPEQIKDFVLSVYDKDAADKWWQSKTKPISLERVAEQLPAWLANPNMGKEETVPGRIIEGAIMHLPRYRWAKTHDEWLEEHYGSNAEDS